MSDENTKVIQINVSSLDERIINWLSNMLKEEMKEAFQSADNERCWAIGATDDTEAQEHFEAGNLYMEYHDILQNAYDDLQAHYT